MRTIFAAVPALLFAGVAVAQLDGRPDPRDPGAKVPPVEFRSAFEGYRPFAEAELRDWRKSNEGVAKPQPPRPEGPGKPGTGKEDAPPSRGHGGHK